MSLCLVSLYVFYRRRCRCFSHLSTTKFVECSKEPIPGRSNRPNLIGLNIVKKNSYLASSRSSFFILNCRLVTGNKNAIRNGASLTKFLGLSMCACFVNGKQIEVNHSIHLSIRHPLSPPVLTNRVLMPPLTHHPKCIESSTGRSNDRISTNHGARSFTKVDILFGFGSNARVW